MKKVTGQVKLQIPAGKANPAPPIGPALGQQGVNIMEFCKQFNAKTQAEAKEGLIIPVIITVYQDRSFTFILKTPPAAILMKKAAGLHTEKKKGRARRSRARRRWGRSPASSSRRSPSGRSRTPPPASLEACMNTIAGTARSMGIDVVG